MYFGPVAFIYPIKLCILYLVSNKYFCPPSVTAIITDMEMVQCSYECSCKYFYIASRLMIRLNSSVSANDTTIIWPSDDDTVVA